MTLYMDIFDAAEIAKKFDKKLIYNDDRVEEFIRQYSKSTSDRLLILLCITRLVDTLPAFSMDDLILRYRAKSYLYIELIIELVRKNSSSVFQLTELWGVDAEIAEYTYTQLDQKNDKKLAHAAGYTLKGLARKDPTKLFQVIYNKNIDNQLSTTRKIAYTIALQGIEHNHEIPSHSVDFVIANSYSEDRALKETAIYTLMLRFNSLTKVGNQLEELCHSDDDTIRFISANLISISRENKSWYSDSYPIVQKTRSIMSYHLSLLLSQVLLKIIQ